MRRISAGRPDPTGCARSGELHDGAAAGALVPEGSPGRPNALYFVYSLTNSARCVAALTACVRCCDRAMLHRIGAARIHVGGAQLSAPCERCSGWRTCGMSTAAAGCTVRTAPRTDTCARYDWCVRVRAAGLCGHDVHDVSRDADDNRALLALASAVVSARLSLLLRERTLFDHHHILILLQLR